MKFSRRCANRVYLLPFSLRPPKECVRDESPMPERPIWNRIWGLGRLSERRRTIGCAIESRADPPSHFSDDH